MSSLLPDKEILKTGWRGLCPKCQKASIYQSRWSLNLHGNCPHCGLDLAENDSADGPAVFLIFVLGFILVPIALYVDMKVLQMPLWLSGSLWSLLTLLLTVGSLKPIKAYIIALQYKHLPWDKKKKEQ